MDTNKMREQFELALVKQAADDGFAKPSLRRNKNNGDYVDPFEQAAWWGWQASRAAVVMELPEVEVDMIDQVGGEQEVRYYPQRALIVAIEAQGLKVAP